MSVRRVMGTEVEYGISVQGQPAANPMVASSQIVNAYASSTVKARRARWDFEEESPLRDARGFDMARQIADPSQLTDEDLGLANVILGNGARLYVDHAHPEYSSPEVTTPLDVVRWEKAGEQVMLDASRMAAQVPGSAPILLYKNNTDNKGASSSSSSCWASCAAAADVRTDSDRHEAVAVRPGAGHRGSGQVGLLEVLDAPSGGLHQRGHVPRELAASGHGPLKGLEPALPAAYGLFGRPPVLERVQSTPVPHHAPCLAEREQRVGNGAQAEGDERTVVRVVRQVETLPVEAGPLDRHRTARPAFRRHLPAEVGRLDRGHGRDLGRVPPDVQPAAEADLQHPAGQPVARDLAELAHLVAAQAQIGQPRHDVLVPHP